MTMHLKKSFKQELTGSNIPNFQRKPNHSHEAKLLILIYRKRYLSKLIIWDIHRKLKHAGTKETLS